MTFLNSRTSVVEEDAYSTGHSEFQNKGHFSQRCTPLFFEI